MGQNKTDLTNVDVDCSILCSFSTLNTDSANTLKENTVWNTVFCHALYMNKDTSVLMQQGHLQLLIVVYLHRE